MDKRARHREDDAPVWSGLVRRFPFSAPLWTWRAVFFHPGLANWGDCRMISTASGRSAFIVAAGLFVLLANPVTAATDADDSAQDTKATAVTHRTFRHAWHHRRHYVHRRSHAVAMKADDKDADNRPADAAPAPADNRVSSIIPPNIPPSVANANAQLLLAGVQLSAAAAIPSGTEVPAMTSTNSANATASSGTLVAAADQLNDADKTLQEGVPAAATTADTSPST